MPLNPGLAVRVQAANGVSADVSTQIEKPTFSTLINGGFGTMTFFVRRLHRRGLPSWLQYLADVKAYDRFAFTLFEGRIDDISMTSQEGVEGFNVEVVGYGPAYAAEPYTNVMVERNLGLQPYNTLDSPQFYRPDKYTMTIGNTSSSDLARVGVAWTARRGTAFSVSEFCIAKAVWANITADLRRVKFDYVATSLSNTAVFAVNIYSIDATGALAGQLTISVSGSGSQSVALPAGTRGVAFGIICTGAGTTGAATDTTAEVYNIRVLGNRTTANSNDEPVYGHEVIQDATQKSSWSQSLVGIDTDTTYAFPEASWIDPTKIGDVLDFVTSFYDRYWAVYEGKAMVWRSSSNPPTITWSTSRGEGAKLDLDPSITNAASAVRVRARTQAGQSFDTVVTDTRPGNIYAAAGATHIAIVDLGIVANSSAAAQIGSVYFPDHSYEVVKGTITLPAQMLVRGQNPGPAYRIRAGDNIQITDAVSPRQIAAGVYDRRTVFLVKATDVDWEAQTVTISVDNTRDSLSQLLARVGIAVPAANPAIK